MRAIELFLVCLLSFSTIEARANPSVDRLENVAIYQPQNGQFLEHQDIYWNRFGQIVQITPTKTTSLNLPQRYVIPGMVDSHIHFFQSGGLYARPDVLDLRKIRDYAVETQWTKSKWREWLNAYAAMGITSVIDVGGPFWNLDIERMAQNDPMLARVSVAGPLISNYDATNLKQPDSPYTLIKTFEDVRNEVARQIQAGFRFIKIWWIDDVNLREQSIRHIQALGKPIFFHSSDVPMVKHAISLGVDFLVHSPDTHFLAQDPELPPLLDSAVKRKPLFLSPTLLVSRNYRRGMDGNFNPTPFEVDHADPRILFSFNDHKFLKLRFPTPERIEANRQESIRINSNAKYLFDHGLITTVGTDAGNTGTLHGTSFFDEMDEMLRIGMSPVDVLNAATINAARVLKRDRWLGLVKPGYQADLVVLRDNPLIRFETLRFPLSVFRSGVLVNRFASDETQVLRTLIRAQLQRFSGVSLSPDFLVTDFSPSLQWALPAPPRPITIEVPGKALVQGGAEAQPAVAKVVFDRSINRYRVISIERRL